MKKTGSLFLYFLFACSYTAMANTVDLVKLRRMYYNAVDSRASAKVFSNTMKSINAGGDPILICYKGMADLIQASHSYNPYSKLAYFNSGKDLLEKAVKAAPTNIEIRFMRYCVQSNAPFFLGYSGETKNDKKFILDGWRNISDQDLKIKIKDYLLQSGKCTTEEKAKLQ